MRDDGYIYYPSNTGSQWVTPSQYLRNRISIVIKGAKSRARTKQMPFDLTIDYLVSIFPEDYMCPALGIEMQWGAKIPGENSTRHNSPSIDRIDNSGGYVPNNVVWVSMLANRIKSSATVDQLFAVSQFYNRLTHNPSLFLPGHTIH